MGFEYKIAFRVEDPAFLDRLNDSASTNIAQPEFMIAFEPDGFYFCDYTKSDASCRAFRKLIEEGLNYSEVVVHEL